MSFMNWLDGKSESRRVKSDVEIRGWTGDDWKEQRRRIKWVERRMEQQLTQCKLNISIRFKHPLLFLLSLSDQPEQTALVFLGGVCVGLLVTLVAIVFQIHCRADCHYGNTNNSSHRHRSRQHHRRHHNCPHRQPGDNNPDSTAVVAAGTGPAGDSESEEWDETSDLSARRRRRFERALLHATMFTSAEGTSHRHTKHDTISAVVSQTESDSRAVITSLKCREHRS